MIKITEERCVYENAFLWLYDDRVTFPNGKPGTYVRLKWKAPFSVAILPIFPDGRILLLNSFNFALDGTTWHVPKGMGTKGSEPVADAKRELLEETGYASQHWRALPSFRVDPGLIENEFLPFLAESIEQVREPRPEETEVICGCRAYPPEDVMTMIGNGQVVDVVTITLMFHLMIRKT